MYDIYLITNNLTNEKYVGCTSLGFKQRFKTHIKESKYGDRMINKAIRKYGVENFSIELIEQVEDEEEAFEREAYHVKRLNTFALKKGALGYNRTLGGKGAKGHHKSKEVIDNHKKMMKERGAWKGENNPKYRKGYLISGIFHPRIGQPLSEITKEKIRKINRVKFKGEKNPQSVNLVCYAKEMETGKIHKTDSFYSLQKLMESIGIKFNRSMAVQVIRGERQHHHKFKFYREDITDKETLDKLEYEYQNNILNPIPITDHRQGNQHPNANGNKSYAENIKTGELLQFDTWYDMKINLEKMTGKTFVRSNMIKVIKGKQKHSFGYKFYREDLTDPDVFREIEERYRKQ